ncbi:hypothetical protein BGZ80_002514 [Entomortierella chlamydospora]|uniref:Uncharacterized protein n=1 Tax=Entomortierella chlamydospora TaxID=101097 RepID=A0A9P6SXL0_9FUNG|nr:hypothetical protein BGZ79_001840 [Entomortierella chlamydospora]KAG0009319.1 hypothetical protein BGZ80_002514 [Entomortierella chlamydospora]
MRLSISTSLIITATLFLASSSITFTAQAQDTRILPPPRAGQTAGIVYWNTANDEAGAEDVPFNVCFTSESASAKYSYLTFAPKNATINFFKDTNCKDFSFGLYGYFGGNPGPAGSLKWVGWSEDYQGERTDEPFQGQPDTTTPQPSTGEQNPGNGGNQNPQPLPDNSDKNQPNNDSGLSSTSFFGIALGTLVVLAIGSVVLWKTAGKKMIEDNKGKSVLPYNRVDGDGDDDILLTTKNKSHDSFALEGEDEDEDESEDDGDEIREHPQQKTQRSG